MCGITGILNFDRSRPVDEQTLIRMRDSLVHRGPDDHGIYIDGPIGLAARRLSIIDLVTGNQPVHNEDRSVWAVLNGEIYNYKLLREDLEKQGHHFYTHGDTEVLVHAYEQFGAACVQRLKGMFAFAIWDGRRRSLFLARDRMGEKPLYYHSGTTGFVFGSELKALMQNTAVPNSIDASSLTKYLTFQFVPAPHTILKGVNKLEPGHTLTVTGDGCVKTDQYWDVPETEEAFSSMNGASSQLLALLRKSVKSQLVADVPVGILLSGGIDSTLVAALAAESSPKVRTFTMAFDEPSYDESRAAKLVADHIGSEHHVEVCRSEAMRDVLPSVMDFMDEPISDASILPTFLITRFTARSVKVALGGDGGDELFAGYPTFHALRLRSVFRALPAPARSLVAAGVDAMPVSHDYISLDFKLRQFLRGTERSPEADFFQWMGAFSDQEKRSLLLRGPDRYNTFEDLARIARGRKSTGEIQRCLYLCAKLYLQDGVLVKVDRASMANSLEVRAPYLDHDLVEFASRCPLHFKMTLRQSKIMLRHAAKDLLPSEILRQRKKRGFGVPIGRWILRELKDYFHDHLTSTRLKQDGIFNSAYVQTLLSDHLSLRRNNWRLLWTLLVFQLWKERWHTNGV